MSNEAAAIHEQVEVLFAMTAAALAEGYSTIRYRADDPAVGEMIACLESMGLAVTEAPLGAAVRIRGCRGHLPATEAQLGAVDPLVRQLTVAMLACGYGGYRIDLAGTADWRPLELLADGLRDLGSRIVLDRASARVAVQGRGLRGARARLAQGAGAEQVAAMLLVSPTANGDVYLEVAGSTGCPEMIEAAVGVIEHFGVELLPGPAGRFVVPAPQYYRGRDWGRP